VLASADAPPTAFNVGRRGAALPNRALPLRRARFAEQGPSGGLLSRLAAPKLRHCGDVRLWNRAHKHPVSAAMHVLRLLQPIVIGRLGGHTLERSLCGRFPRRGHLAEWCWAWRTTSPRRALAS
jgi:hypothetical protein